MAKLGTITFTGASGTKYEFDVYPFGESFSEVGAVYVITERTPKSKGGADHTRIYIGQTGDLSERFDTHHKADCFQRHDANCICVHRDDDEDSRLAKERDLLAAYSQPCND